jgi:hypothetical protein
MRVIRVLRLTCSCFVSLHSFPSAADRYRCDPTVKVATELSTYAYRTTTDIRFDRTRTYIALSNKQQQIRCECTNEQCALHGVSVEVVFFPRSFALRRFTFDTLFVCRTAPDMCKRCPL